MVEPLEMQLFILLAEIIIIVLQVIIIIIVAMFMTRYREMVLGLLIDKKL